MSIPVQNTPLGIYSDSRHPKLVHVEITHLEGLIPGH